MDRVAPRLDERYRVTAPLGEGAAGEVWRCEDLLLHEAVAVKVFHAAVAGPLLRRELAALQALDLPGAARLLDSGETLDAPPRPFLVMELVTGEAFPTGPLPWEAVRPWALALLHSLRLLHGAGVVHRDLKPAHLLRQRDGRVVLLDLGLAAGPGAGPRRGARLEAGTPLWMAPEQFLNAEDLGPQADLYAVGLLLDAALTGQPLRQGLDRLGCKRAALAPSTPSVARRCAGLPAAVVSLIDALLARRPADRPADADAALEALGDDGLGRLHALLAAQPDPAALFAGPAAVFHIPEDGAALLRRQAGEDPRQQARELSSWLASGLACWQGDRLALSPHQLRARRGALPVPWPFDADACLGQAEAAWARGEVDPALALLDRGLAQVSDDEAAEVRLLEARVQFSLGQHTASLRRSLYALDRAARPATAPLGLLLRAALRGRGDPSGLGGPTVDELPAFADEGLDRWRPALRIERAQHAATLADLDAAVAAGWDWAASRGTSTAAADAWNWEGLRLRRHLRFSEAAAAHGRAAAGKAHATGRLSARLNEADARLEAAELEAAVAAASAVCAEAATLRLPLYEGRALRILRAADFRRGHVAAPWPDLEEAATLLGDMLGGELLFTEATLAWSGGDLPRACRLAAAAARLWSIRNERALPLLAQSLAEACAPVVERPRLARLAEAVQEANSPGLQLQALALIGWADPLLAPSLAAARARLADALPAELRVGVRELFSVAAARSGAVGARGQTDGSVPAEAAQGRTAGT